MVTQLHTVYQVVADNRKSNGFWSNVHIKTVVATSKEIDTKLQ